MVIANSEYCKRGHPRNSTNRYVAPKNGRVGCYPCRIMVTRSYIDKGMFNGNRELAIQRDGEKCVKCGITRPQHQEKYGRDITVDHIDNNGRSKPVEQKNNSLDNLQTLCMPCHARKDNQQGKLTDIQVINIRHIGDAVSYREISKLYGVSAPYISCIIRGIWRKDLINQKGLSYDTDR